MNEKPEMAEEGQKQPKPFFDDRSPENLEKFYEFVEEFQKKDVDFQEETGKSDEPGELQKPQRVRTAHRLKYEAQVDVIRRQIGDLEDIRRKLSLSRRKMCQMLLVDPSAWTRWTKEGAPPYVYRALEWYMLLTKEAPAQAHSYWITASGGNLRSDTNEVRKLEQEYLQLRSDIERMQLLERRRRPLQYLVVFVLGALTMIAFSFFLKLGL